MRIFLTTRYERRAPRLTPQLRRQLLAAGAQALRATDCRRNAEVSLVLTDDQGIRRLNRDYRGLDRATDVLSFAMQEGEDGSLLRQEAAPGQPPLLLGDIVISWQRAAAQAAEIGQSQERELLFLFIHGLLHLLGYDHERGPEAEREMFALQDIIIAKSPL